MGRIRVALVLLLLLSLVGAFSDCGGGGSGGLTNPPPSFSIQANPSNLSISPASTSETNLTLQALNGFSGTVTVTLSGLPAGVTSSPSSPFNLPASGLTVVFSAASSVSTGNYSLTVQGTGGSASARAMVSLTIAASSGSLPGNRTNFVRTDDTPSVLVYDPVHKLVYAALPDLARVSAIDPATNQVVRSISVPDAHGLSLTPDGTRVLVSGLSQQIAWIDTTSRQIVQRNVLPLAQPQCSACSPELVSPGSPMVLASGKVLFVGSTTSFNGILEWDPAASQVVDLNLSNFGQGTFGVRSADGTKALFSRNDSSGDIALFDSTADTFVATQSFLNSSTFPIPFALAANPSGTQFVAAVNGSGVFVLDSHLNVVGQVPVGGILNGMIYSPDGRMLYVGSTPANVPLISTIDMTTLQLVGQAPAFTSNIVGASRPPMVESPMAVDSTGLVFGSADHGVALDDATFFQNIGLATIQPIFTIIAKPAEGPQASYTPITITTQSFSTAPDVWFGTINGTNFSLNSLGQARATAPPSPIVGPVNLKIISSDGTEANMPEWFTYGAVAAESPLLATPPSGGVYADIFGYGFGSDTSAPVQVNSGTSAASVQSSTLFDASGQGYPFPLDQIHALVPPGSPGVADITVTALAGTAKIQGGIRYLQNVTDYPSPDTFQFILYDATRQQLYLSAVDHIDVFSIPGHVFISQIALPSLSGSRQILGLALTPDGSKLLAANFSDNSVAIIDPDNSSTAQAVQIVPTGSSLCPEGPTELAATSTGHAFVSIASNSCGTGAIYDLNLATLAVNLSPVGTLLQASQPGNYLSASRDGSKVLVVVPGSAPGPVYVWDAATATWSTDWFGNGFWDGATSGDGNVFAVSGGTGKGANAGFSFVDALANRLSVTGLPDYIPFLPSQQGMKLNDSGSLLYAPVYAGFQTQALRQSAVDIYDVQKNELRERILLSESFASPTSQATNALALDTSGQNVFLITQSGLTVLALDSVPLSIGSVSPTFGAPGNVVTIRGSGFTSSTTVSFGTISANPTIIDSNTLRVAVPGTPGGPTPLTLADPNGFAYTLDAAFVVN